MTVIAGRPPSAIGAGGGRQAGASDVYVGQTAGASLRALGVVEGGLGFQSGVGGCIVVVIVG